MRFIILFFLILSKGIINDDVFIVDTIILVDKLIVSLTLLITKLLSGLLYWPPVAIASIVQELFSLLIEMLLPAIRLILSCLLSLKSVIDVLMVDRFDTKFVIVFWLKLFQVLKN